MKESLTGANVCNCVELGTLAEHRIDTMGNLVHRSSECTDGDVIQAICEVCRLGNSSEDVVGIGPSKVVHQSWYQSASIAYSVRGGRGFSISSHSNCEANVRMRIEEK